MKCDTRVYLTICFQRSKGINIKYTFNHVNIPQIEFHWIMTPEMVPGQFLIVAQREDKTALYTLDSNNKPFQISGTRDLLLDAEAYDDLTIEYRQILSNVHGVLNQIFMNLSIQEMYHYSVLSEFEWLVKEAAINQRMTFTQIVDFCYCVISNLEDKVLSSKLEKSLKGTHRKNIKIIEPFVDWSGYGIKSQTTTFATG